MERSPNPSKNERLRNLPAGGASEFTVDEKIISTLIAERTRFHRFLAARIGEESAEDLLQESLLQALKGSAKLRRGESAVAWFYRILRNAVADHFRHKQSESGRLAKFVADLEARGENAVLPPPDWDKAVCSCFHSLLPLLKPRYAEVIRRVDLVGESKLEVARDLKVKRATMDVLLHRARTALRERLEIWCGACSREKCIECFCG